MIKFLHQFFRQSGTWVASSFFISKMVAFLLTLFMARLLSKEDFGWVMYGLNYLSFFVPLVGLGSANGTLRYTVISEKGKDEILKYSFSMGLVLNFMINAVMLFIALLIFKLDSTFLLITIFSIRFLGVYLQEQAKAEARARFNNKKYGLIDIFVNGVFFISAIVMSYFFGVQGYIISLCISPFAVLFLHRFKFTFSGNHLEDISKKEFWKFCISMAITNQISELIFLLDVFFIGIFLDTASVANYRVASIVPFNLIFIATVFFQTSYPVLCEKHLDNKFQLNYLFGYWKLMLPISLIIILFFFNFDKEILGLFSEKYKENSNVFRILIVAIISVLLLRTPFGYLLASKGKSNFNLVAATISIVSLVAFVKPMLTNYGLVGLAWLSLVNLFIIGLFQMIAYFYFIKIRK